MASNREPLGTNFDQRLWLNGGRNGMPAGTLRRAVGVAPELTGSLLSRWGSDQLYPIDAINVYKWNGIRYQYDGAVMYANGSSIQSAINAATGASGFTGGYLTFVEAPPQPGLQDYLFVLGGGIPPFKIAPNGTITRWGIQAPGNGATVQHGSPAQIVIDNMTTNNTANWTNRFGCTLSFDGSADDPYLAGGCYQVVTSTSEFTWHIDLIFGSTRDWSQYPASGPISLQSDLFSIYANWGDPSKQIFFVMKVDVDDGTFKTNYYQFLVQIVASTSVANAAGSQAIIVPAANQWIQVAGAKAQFLRIGPNLNLDWSNVQGVRLEGGIYESPSHVFLNGLQIYGGYPLGIGPAALTGGSQYQYGVTFGNSVTGSDSNPNGMQVQADGTVNPPTPFIVQGVALAPDFLSLLPLSTDPQVNNRKLWRTTAGGSLFSYLDTIPDNTTTTYEDVTGDLPGQPLIVTPWTANVVVPAVAFTTYPYKIDGGNGFWFYESNGGTTGATIPQWNIPTGPFLGDWVPWITYSPGDWVNYRGTGYLCLVENRIVVPTSSLGTDWSALGTTNDNGVIWHWGGLNAVRSLGIDSLLLDNQQPLLSYGDVAGPFEGGLFWTRDSTAGRQGWGYASPPGRPESVGTSFVISPGEVSAFMQKIVIWDQLPWALSTTGIYILQGSYPAFSPTDLKGGLGTSWPYTVVVTQNAVYYRGPDGIRMFDRGGSVLAGFDAISDIFRGRTRENVSPFYPVWGALVRNEIFFGDNTVTFGLGGQSPTNLLNAPTYVWRMLGQALLCAFYERDDDEILASFGGNTVLFESYGALTDGG